MEREREKAARIKAEAAKAAAVAQAVADREAVIARLAAVMEQQPAAQPEADGSAVKQADASSQHVPSSSPVLQTDAVLAEEQPSKRRCVHVCNRQAQAICHMCGMIFSGLP